jgi:hypothetical protein
VDPVILMLDEATSALDGITETAVKEQLATLRATRIFIAHRLSTVVNADRILVMHEGALVEEGTHEELLALGGFYADLVAGQMGDRARARGVSVPVPAVPVPAESGPVLSGRGPAVSPLKSTGGRPRAIGPRILERYAQAGGAAPHYDEEGPTRFDRERWAAPPAPRGTRRGA